jgi:hypothetical protein
VQSSRFVQTLARFLRGKAGMTSRLGGGVTSQVPANLRARRRNPWQAAAAMVKAWVAAGAKND